MIHALRYWKFTKRFLIWKLRNPGRPFSEFYSRCISQMIDAGKPHCTLGSNPSNPEWFDRSATSQLEFLKRKGLQPSHCCLDYGCGSLRLGRYLIQYLEADRYIGIDITDKFYNEGLKAAGSLFKDKNPSFYVISPEVLKRLSSADLDMIISTGVLMHVPLKEVDAFLKNIVFLLNDHTTAFISFKCADMYTRIGAMSWAFPEMLLEEKVRALGGVPQVFEEQDLDDSRESGTGKPRMLKITK